jgi:tetratricopeptide (TPR) repeat protein
MNVSFDQLQILYEQNRFLDAYHQTEPLWKDRASLGRLSAEELTIARRLAFRIGGSRTYRWIVHQAARRFHDHPLFRGHWGLSAKHTSLLDYLRDFYRSPQLNSGIARYDCEWLCDHAEMLANVRDFPEANRVLELARGIDDGPIVAATRATVLLRQDRLEEAASISRRLWKERPGRPALARLLCHVLARKGLFDEILQSLESPAASGQSFEITILMCWYLCAMAERSSASQYKEFAHRSHDLSLRLPQLAPLQDKDTVAAIACARADSALILGDRAAMRENADKIRSGFYKQVVQNLQANPDGKFVLVPHRQVYQKHATCLPTSISAVLGAFGQDIDADELAQAITYSGTSSWRAVDWLHSHGYATRTFVGNGRVWRALLDAGVPFVLTQMRMSWAHAVAVIGYDDAQGTLIIHDPSAERWGHALLERLEKSEAPFGPECLAVVPADRADLLACIPEESARWVTACHQCYKLAEISGSLACAPIVGELSAADPSNPFSRRMQAIQAVADGRLFEAIEQQEKLLAEYPESIPLRLDLVSSLARTNDTARIIRVQGDVVERGLLPGIAQNQAWFFPPAPYTAQYADYIGQHLAGMKKAVRLLNRAIFYEYRTAQLYHVLGDVYLRHGHFEQGLLPHRVAALLEITNDHYARALCDVLRRLGREDEGIEFLRWRVGELGQRIYGAYPYICLIGALEDFGRPDEAIASLHEAQQCHRDDGALQAFASRFWVRMGRWDLAEAALQIAHEKPGPAYLPAAVEFNRAKGNWPQALELCQQWVQREPKNTVARRSLLRLLWCRDGSLAMEGLSRGWMEEHKNDELFEGIYYDVLKELDDHRIDAFLRNRLARNPLDAWIWRELGFRLGGQFDQASPDRRDAVLDELRQTLQKVIDLSGDCPPRYALEADMLSSLGQFPQSMEAFFKALEIDAGYSYPYRRIWSLAGRLPVQEQRQVLGRLEKHLLLQTGHLFEASRLSMAVAQTLGIEQAETAVQRWLRQRPDDPELIFAQADLWLTRGRGQSDARRAAEILTKAIARFVNHEGLRFLQAKAHAVLLQETGRLEAFEEILRRQPLNTLARFNVAMAHARTGRPEKAVEIIQQGRTVAPANADAYERIADVLEFLGRPEASLEAVLAGTQLVPERISLWERAIHLQQQLGRHGEAVALSKKLVLLFPRGAYVWYLHAVALGMGPTSSDFLAIEQALRTSLSLNAALWSAACRLSNVLIDQHRFDEAKEVVQRQMPLFEDACYHKAQLATIMWAQGRRQEAIGAMAAVLAVSPRATWAWSHLLNWIDEQKDWTIVPTVLKDVPPVMTSNAAFRAQRLTVLQKAGWSAQELDKLWQELLNDFPAQEPIYLDRFDMLWGDNRMEEAKRVLDHIRRLHPNSEFVAARTVHVLIREKKNAPEALQQAMAIWTNLREISPWPADHAWVAIGNSNVAAQAVSQLYDWLIQGRAIRPSAVPGFLKYFHKAAFKRNISDFLSFAKLTSDSLARVRAMRKLLDVLERQQWDDGRCRAKVLVAMCKVSPGDGWTYFRTHPSCQTQTPVWAEGCRTFIWKSRKWLSQWRQHKDVKMYAVTNYTLSIRGKGGRRRLSAGDLQEIADSSRDALKTLVYDSTPRYLACGLCEAQLRLGRHEEFVASMKQYAGLIDNQDKRLWMEGYKTLPTLLGHFLQLLQSKNENEVCAATRAFMNSSCARGWAARLWRRMLRKRVSLPKWLSFAIRLST